MGAALLAAASSLGVACTTDADDQVVETPSTTSAAAGASTSTAPEPLVTTCLHETFRLSYPADWHEAEVEGAEPCRFLHPEPIQVAPGTEALDVAVSVKLEDIAFAELESASADERQIARRELAVDGREAFATEVESTGDGLLDEGVRSYRIVVDVDGRHSLVISTIDRPVLDYAANKRVIDAVAATIVFAG